MSDYIPDPDKAFGEDFDILKIADEYAKAFLSQHFISVQKPDAKGVIHISMDSNPDSMARNQLIIDGFMIENPKNSGNFYFTSEGRYFISKGGYAARMAEREELSKLNKAQLQSVIDTNKSVKKTNKIQIASLVTTFVIILFALFIQFLSYEKEKPETQPIINSIEELKHKVDLLRSQYDSLNLRLNSLKK